MLSLVGDARAMALLKIGSVIGLLLSQKDTGGVAGQLRTSVTLTGGGGVGSLARLGRSRNPPRTPRTASTAIPDETMDKLAQVQVGG